MIRLLRSKGQIVGMEEFWDDGTVRSIPTRDLDEPEGKQPKKKSLAKVLCDTYFYPPSHIAQAAIDYILGGEEAKEIIFDVLEEPASALALNHEIASKILKRLRELAEENSNE